MIIKVSHVFFSGDTFSFSHKHPCSGPLWLQCDELEWLAVIEVTKNWQISVRVTNLLLARRIQRTLNLLMKW